MTIDYKIIVGHKLDEQEKDNVQKTIGAVFREIDEIYNKWNPNSEISTLNKLKAKQTYPLSSQLELFLNQVQYLFEVTEGRFDPTIEPIQALWKRKLEAKKRPTEFEIAEIVPAVGWDKIHFGDGFFWKDHDLTQIDLGGIAKGYCVDLLIEKLTNLGLTNIFVEWGGEIHAVGMHPDRRNWNIFISRLGDDNPDNALAYLSLENQAIATSGDYLQNWTVEDKIYFHLFNPFNNQAMEATQTSIASASVLAPNCTLADGLASAALVFSDIPEAMAWAKRVQEKIPNTTFWLVSREQLEQ